MDAFQKMMEKISAAMERSKALGPGIKVGKVFKMPVADGYAVYEVVKVNKTTVKVAAMETPDGYCDRILGYGGSFQKSIIEPLVTHEDRMQALFGRKVRS